MAQWQQLGADRNSRFADPGFVDMAGGEYRLRPDSPALELGFKPFPLDRFGTRNRQLMAMVDRLRPAAGAGDGVAITATTALYVTWHWHLPPAEPGPGDGTLGVGGDDVNHQHENQSPCA